MAFNATVIADSISRRGCRLTTFELTYPRIIHAELMTHRLFSRNSASTRAIPLASQLYNLIFNPFIPERFGYNQPGMQSENWLPEKKYKEAVKIWLAGRDRAVTTVLELILGREIAEALLGYDSRKEFVSGKVLREKFDEIKAAIPLSTDEIDYDSTTLLNVHKQLAGRGLEAYMWHTVVVSATEFENFFALRDHKDAQGEIATIARLMRAAYDASRPVELNSGEWHLPYVDHDEIQTDSLFGLDWELGIQLSAARCAAISYNRQHNRNPEAEVKRYWEDLRAKFHMSPVEHQATPFDPEESRVRQLLQYELAQNWRHLTPRQSSQLHNSLEFAGNFRGWWQHRKDIPYEDNFGNAPLES